MDDHNRFFTQTGAWFRDALQLLIGHSNNTKIQLLYWFCLLVLWVSKQK